MVAGSEMTSVLDWYRACQPPLTPCAAAMVNRVSPATTVYDPPAAGPAAGTATGCGLAAAGCGAGAGLPAGTSRRVGPSPPPAYAQVQATQPCSARVFSATAICCSRVATSARGAESRPP